MKFERQLYTNYILPKETPYFDLFVFPTHTGSTVTFQENKKLPVFSWFPYKQGFSKNLVERIIKEEKLPRNAVIYDPFLGCGTTSLTALTCGYAGFGSDYLPLCTFVSTTKIMSLTVAPEIVIPSAIEVLSRKDIYRKEWPDVPIIQKAIPIETQSALMNYRLRIEKSDYPSKLKNLLLLALLSSIDKCAYLKKDGGFPRLVPNKVLRNVDEVFLQTCDSFRRDLLAFKQLYPRIHIENIARSKIDSRDARKTGLKDESVDLVITSPPYLNKTDYTRVYSLELCFLFIETFADIRSLRYNSFCSHVEARSDLPRHPLPFSLERKLKELSGAKLTNPKHPYMVLGYFQDLHYSLAENYRYLKKNGRAAWVVWNSRLSGIHFPVDTYLCEIAEVIGFTIEKVECVRLTGTSAQQAKIYGDKPLRESIIYLSKGSR